MTYSIGTFAKKIGKSVRTLQRWDSEGILIASRNPKNRRFYTDIDLNKYFKVEVPVKKNILYCRVSSNNQKDDLKNQELYCLDFCKNSGIFINEIYKDIGSGLNYNRKYFNKLLLQVENNEIENIIVAHKDRFIRFGYDWFESFCNRHNCLIKVINDERMSPEKEIVQDLISIIHVFSCRVYGLRKYSNKIKEDTDESL